MCSQELDGMAGMITFTTVESEATKVIGKTL
jgi:hypothetical protein